VRLLLPRAAIKADSYSGAGGMVLDFLLTDKKLLEIISFWGFTKLTQYGIILHEIQRMCAFSWACALVSYRATPERRGKWTGVARLFCPDKGALYFSTRTARRKGNPCGQAKFLYKPRKRKKTEPPPVAAPRSGMRLFSTLKNADTSPILLHVGRARGDCPTGRTEGLPAAADPSTIASGANRTR